MPKRSIITPKKVLIWIAQRVMFALALVLYILIAVPYARLERRTRQRKKEKPRILWGTTPIINIRYGSMATRLYGYKSDTVVYSVSHINQGSDFDHVIEDYLSRYMKVGSLLRKAILGLVAPYFIFFWMSLKYDIFHFYFDGGFLWPFGQHRLELPLLHLAGKKIIVLPYGCDARLENKTKCYKYNFCMYCAPPTKVCNETKTRRRLEYFCKYSDIVLGCADLVDCLPRHDGIWQYPIDLSEWPPLPLPDNPTIKIVHAANHRLLKGTSFLIRVIDELKSEGYPLELVLVERMLNREARKIYEQADIIADQFLGGAYALFSIEGMALGKPVMCYLREELFQFHPEWAECPIVNTSPDNLKQQLIMLINDRQLRQELGRKGIEYVKKYHSLEAVGAMEDKFYRYLWNHEEKCW